MHVVQQYFRRTRPELVTLGCKPALIKALDSAMQDLLLLSNSRNLRSSYRKALGRIGEAHKKIAIERELRLGQRLLAGKPTLSLSGFESSLLNLLGSLIQSAALSYRQALIDLGSEDRVSYRGTANELRETLREILDRLAPDKELAKAGIAVETGEKGYTQKQKVRYILRSRQLAKTAIQAPQDAVALIDELTASLARSTYQRSAVATHVAMTKREVQRMKRYVDTVLADVLETEG